MGHYLVTGTASGVGREVTRLLLTQGHAVTGWDRAPSGPDGSSHVQVDLASASEVAAAAESLPSGLSGLLNVAGVPGTAPPEVVLEVNLYGTCRVTDRVAPLLERGGSVVTVASIAAHRSDLGDGDVGALLDELTAAQAVARFGLDGPRAYDASKKALLAWSARLCGRLLPAGVRACTVSPGPVETPILGDFEATMGDAVARSAAVLTRHATAAEVAAAVVFLAGPDASWVNGVDLRVDGGLVTLASLRDAGQAVST